MPDAPQERQRPRRVVWVFPAAVRRDKERRAAASPPLPGYLCEQCQDAPAVQWQPAPWGGEMGGCTACRTPTGGAAEEKPARRPSLVDGIMLADPPEDDTP
jgi:hypothetical protein